MSIWYQSVSPNDSRKKSTEVPTPTTVHVNQLPKEKSVTLPQKLQQQNNNNNTNASTKIMTIKIEQEAMIRVLDTAICSLPCHPTPPLKPPSTGGVGAIEGGPSSLPSPYVAVAQKPTDDCFYPDLQSLDSDEDCISLSSYGSASSFGGESTERRVSFAAQLVTEVKTRPRTKECDKRLLFYTQSETDR